MARTFLRFCPANERRRAGMFGNMFNEIYPVRAGILHENKKFLQKIEKNIEKMFGNIKNCCTFVSGSR